MPTSLRLHLHPKACSRCAHKSPIASNVSACVLYVAFEKFQTCAVACRSDFQKIVAKIMALDYSIPEKLQLSDSVKDLLSRIFVKDPERRITIPEIKQHEWYLHRLPFELCEGYKGFPRCAASLLFTFVQAFHSVGVCCAMAVWPAWQCEVALLSIMLAAPWKLGTGGEQLLPTTLQCRDRFPSGRFRD